MFAIQSLLNKAVDDLIGFTESPLLDAEVLLCFVLDKERSYLRAWYESVVTEPQYLAFMKLIQQRQKGIPIAYLIGNREFWSRDFYVTPAVLIPRPDTELLIELSLQIIAKNQPVRIIDLGTGSGIIAITLALECPNAQVVAVDSSLAALDVAKQNAERYQLNGIQFYQSDWFNAVPLQAFDLVISNPPYIAKEDKHLQQGDLRFEPSSALVAEEQGLSDIKTIATQTRGYLKPNGHLLVEHGFEQAQAVQAIFNALNYTNVQSYQDLAGHQRVTHGCLG